MPALRFAMFFVDVALLLLCCKLYLFFPPRQVLKALRIVPHAWTTSTTHVRSWFIAAVHSRLPEASTHCILLLIFVLCPACRAPLHLWPTRSGVRDFCRRDAQQCPDVGVDVLLDDSVTRLATFTRVYDAVNFPLFFATPHPAVMSAFVPMTFPSFDLRRTVYLCRGVCIRNYATTCGLFPVMAHPWPASR
jgi:hypothetical protein